ncbi:MAG TPA: hypothetical protein VGB66_17795 [Longimicrobium sp.]|jgi:hypothetical protein
MFTLTGQAAISAVLLLFAAVAWRIVRAIPRDSETYRFGWALTAATFTIRGLNSAFHDAFSIVGFAAGPDSWAWSAVISWHPVLNHSRTFLLITFCILFTVVLVRAGRGRAEPGLRRALLVLAAGMVAGGAVGWVEPDFSGLSHYTAVAVWDVVELLAMLSLLFVGLNSGRMDRGLWYCLGINAFVLALSVLWFAALIRIDFGGQWAPERYHIHLTKAFLYVLMVGVAYRQLGRMRNGERMKGFFGPAGGKMMPSLHG